MLWLYDHLSHKVCRDVAHTAMARLLKVQVLTQLSLYDHALLCLSELLTGSGLPSTTTHHDRLVESNWVRDCIHVANITSTHVHVHQGSHQRAVEWGSATLKNIKFDVVLKITNVF